ncbi:hypothetical protein [Priestia filamentosa]|uniref:hypothetical protein n=1 Tax=Priestia filamentosa TaxID=1402861 RepID=UPI000E75FF7A|nr:hypothetical protein [Priestia filamentosa]RJS63103.1 hypothetical protein CJ485_23145 [Priestia filamentosa]
MLVKHILHKIINKDITIRELSSLYNVSDDAIQSKIKELGYEWDSKRNIYNYIGEHPEPINIKFDTLFNKSIINESRKYNVDKKITNVKSSSENQEDDSIDRLLKNPRDRSKRSYKGFYLDNDVLQIINHIPKSYKSELVNEALRKVFKEKGLLD